MFTKKVKTTGGDLTISIPSDISEVSIGLLVDLTPEPGNSFSPLEVLSKLSGVPVGGEVMDDTICLLDICNPDDIALFDDVLIKLAFQIKVAQSSEVLPREVIIMFDHDANVGGNFKRWFGKSVKGKVVKINTDLGIQPVGAYNEAREVIKAEFEEWERVKKEHGEDIEFSPSINSLLRVLAHYLYVPATGLRYNETKATEFIDTVKKLPAAEALPIAKYFFLKYAGYRK